MFTRNILAVDSNAPELEALDRVIDQLLEPDK